MNLKKTLSIVLAFMMLVCISPVTYADAAASDVAITQISNVIEAGEVVIKVEFNVPEFEEQDLDPWSPVSTSLVIYEKDADGEFTVEVHKDQLDVEGDGNGDLTATGTFELALGIAQECELLAVINTPYGTAEKKFLYENKAIELLESVIGSEGDVDPAVVEEFIVNRAGLLCVDTAIFETLSDKTVVTDAVVEAMRAEGGIANVSEFQSIFTTSLLVGCINELKTEAVKTIVADENQQSNLGKVYSLWVACGYDKLDDAALSQKVASLKAKGVANAEELVETLMDITVETFFVTEKYYKDYAKLFVASVARASSDDTNIYGLSTAADGEIAQYNALTPDARKEIALKALWDANKATAITTTAALKTAVTKAIKVASDAVLDDGGSGGGPGGNGPSGDKTPAKDPFGGTTISKPAEGVNTSVIFGDVPSNAWYAQAVGKLYAEGIVSGKGEGKFDPSSKVTREEFAQMIYKLTKVSAASSASFTDVAEGAWYAPAVSALASKNIISGMGETFGVGLSIKRRDMAVMIYNTLAYLGSPMASSDSVRPVDLDSIPEYARGAVTALMSANLLKGYEDGSFGPENNVTRAEAAQAIYYVVNHMEER